MNMDLIPFIAIGRHDETAGFIIEASLSADEDSRDVFESYAKYKLKSVESVSILMSTELDMERCLSHICASCFLHTHSSS